MTKYFKYYKQQKIRIKYLYTYILKKKNVLMKIFRDNLQTYAKQNSCSFIGIQIT